MEDEIVNLEGEGDSKVTIGGLREKAYWKHRCCLYPLPSREQGHSASDYFGLNILFALLTTRTIS